SGPTSIAFDSHDNLFIADRDNFCVRRISADGIINTVAGTGQKGFSGEGGKATAAAIRPLAVATDKKGNFYISDLSARILKVDSNGILTTIAGMGVSGFNSDNLPGPETRITPPTALAADDKGNLYFADFGNYRVRKIDAGGMVTTVGGSGIEGYII